MIVDDFTLEWISPRRAILSWDGGSVDSWWTVFLDGKSALSFLGSGEISKEVTLSRETFHSVTIVQHDAAVESQDSPDAPRLFVPTIRWLAIENAAEYLVYLVDANDQQFLVKRQLLIPGQDIYTFVLPDKAGMEGLERLLVRVYARGSWGLCEVPQGVTGILAGFPPAVRSLEIDSVSGSELYLVLAS